jgi:hypothetical protein
MRLLHGWVATECVWMGAGQFTPKMNIARLETCQQLLAHYKNEGNGFLFSIVTGDKFGVSL